ncbi:MAG: 23S rRNA (adenine(2503)-C(2))-methyltransferase RlmN [Synergistaceae bacterium]|nr:23S rRNA (adenine(2503)-C(2))-methyltransferase RlmN [Synergistaceae bacterium]
MSDNNRNAAIDFDFDDWAEYFAGIGEPTYRAGQMCSWLWKRGVFDAASMTDFGKSLRERISSSLDFSHPEIARVEQSRDGTEKFLMLLHDGATVETAMLRQGDRLTACISTQVGCPIGCPFCATGSDGFVRNLTRGEIAGQFAVMESHAGREINNVVFMGMGEPFLNTEEVLNAVRFLNSPKMRGLGIRHITISTAGVVPGIKSLTESGLGVRLAVSLHAADDDLRDELVPCNSNYPLRELMSALRDYQRTTGDRVTIEYALFKDRNDSIERARELVRLLHGLHAYINLIPANDNDGGYERSEPERALRFQSVLKSAGFESEIRVERGGEIIAACGQLRRASSDITLEQKAAIPSARREKILPASRVTSSSSDRRGDKTKGRVTRGAGLGKEHTEDERKDLKERKKFDRFAKHPQRTFGQRHDKHEKQAEGARGETREKTAKISGEGFAGAPRPYQSARDSHGKNPTRRSQGDQKPGRSFAGSSSALKPRGRSGGGNSRRRTGRG